MNKPDSTQPRLELHSPAQVGRFSQLESAVTKLESANGIFSKVGKEYFKEKQYIGRGFAFRSIALYLQLSAHDKPVYAVSSKHRNPDSVTTLFASGNAFKISTVATTSDNDTENKQSLTPQELLDGGDNTAFETELFDAYANRVNVFALNCLGRYNRSHIAIPDTVAQYYR